MINDRESDFNGPSRVFLKLSEQLDVAPDTVEIDIAFVLREICVFETKQLPKMFLTISSKTIVQLRRASKAMNVRWSNDRSFDESIPALNWRPDDRLTEVYSDSVFLIAFLTLCTRRWAGCTLPAGLVSRENLTVFAMRSRFNLGVEIFTPRSRFV